MVVPNPGITYIRPCVVEAGKTSAETHLSSAEDGSETSSDFLDSSKLCWLLNLTQMFSRVKCSENLGIAKMEFKGKTVVVSKGGRINVRTAENMEDALETTWLALKAMWPAMICVRCRKAILECVSGSCGKCEPRGCALLANGPPKPTQMFDNRRGVKSVRQILEELDASGSAAFEHAKHGLDGAFHILQRAVAALPSEGPTQNDITIREELEKAAGLAQRLIVTGQKQIDMSSGLILLGISTNLEMLGQIVGSVAKLALSHSDHLLLERTWNVVTESYSALWKSDLAQPRSLRTSYASVSKTLGKARRDGTNTGFLGNLMLMAELCLRFSRTMPIFLAV